MSEENPISRVISKYGYYSMVVAAAVFLIGTFTAMLTYSGYDFLNQFFSDLGSRGVAVSPNDPTDIRAKANFPEIFNITLMIAGVLTLPFFPYVARRMQHGEISGQGKLVGYYMAISTFLFITVRKNSWFEVPDLLALGATGSLLFGFLLMAVVGFRSREDLSNGLYYTIAFTGINVGPWLFSVGVLDLSATWTGHVYVAISLYYFLAFSSLYWAIATLAAKANHPYKSSKLWLVDMIYALVIIFAVYANILGKDGLAKIPVANSLSVESYQKMIAYTFISYFGFVVSNRIKRMAK